jgi:hypothetical protein
MNERYLLSDVLKNISEVGTADSSLVKDLVNSAGLVSCLALINPC